MHEIAKELISLYMDLTESKAISVQIGPRDIEIKIIAHWFESQTPLERQEYLFEGLEVIFPEIAKNYRVKFIALAPNEIKHFSC